MSGRKVPSDRPETLGSRLSSVARVALNAIVALLVLATAAFLPRALDLSPWVGFWSLLVVFVVLAVAHGLRSYPLHTFGIRRRVGYAVAREGRCDECGDAIAAGERRRYARQAVAFGVPLHTLDWSVNTYCGDCRTHDDGSDHTKEETHQYEDEMA